MVHEVQQPEPANLKRCETFLAQVLRFDGSNAHAHWLTGLTYIKQAGVEQVQSAAARKAAPAPPQKDQTNGQVVEDGGAGTGVDTTASGISSEAMVRRAVEAMKRGCEWAERKNMAELKFWQQQLGIYANMLSAAEKQRGPAPAVVANKSSDAGGPEEGLPRIEEIEDSDEEEDSDPHAEVLAREEEPRSEKPNNESGAPAEKQPLRGQHLSPPLPPQNPRSPSTANNDANNDPSSKNPKIVSLLVRAGVVTSKRIDEHKDLNLAADDEKMLNLGSDESEAVAEELHELGTWEERLDEEKLEQAKKRRRLENFERELLELENGLLRERERGTQSCRGGRADPGAGPSAGVPVPEAGAAVAEEAGAPAPAEDQTDKSADCGGEHIPLNRPATTSADEARGEIAGVTEVVRLQQQRLDSAILGLKTVVSNYTNGLGREDESGGRREETPPKSPPPLELTELQVDGLTEALHLLKRPIQDLSAELALRAEGFDLDAMHKQKFTEARRVARIQVRSTIVCFQRETGFFLHGFLTGCVLTAG